MNPLKIILKQIAFGYLIVLLILPLLILPIFFSAGFFASIWGSKVLDTILGGPPDLSQPLVWFFLVFTLTGMLIMVVISYCLIVLPLLAISENKYKLVLSPNDPEGMGRLKRFAARKMYKLASSYRDLVGRFVVDDAIKKEEGKE